MHKSVEITVAPASEPVSLTEAKSWLRVDTADEDTLIARIISAARIWCEKITGLATVNQTVAVRWDAFEPVLKLPRWPVLSVSSIEYVDTAGVTQTLAASDYYTDIYSRPARIVPAYGVEWPDTLEQINAVKVTLVVGPEPASSSDAPPDFDISDVKLAMQQLIGHWFIHREAIGVDAGPVAMAVESLLYNNRIWRL